MRREVIVLVCDWCGADETTTIVRTHTLRVDEGQAVAAEACDNDWQRVIESFAVFAIHGRPVVTQTDQPRKRTPPQPAVAFPGTDWRFTFHALQRMGERSISPERALAVVSNPATVFEGEQKNGAMVHLGRDLRVVLDPERRTILTVANRSDP